MEGGLKYRYKLMRKREVVARVYTLIVVIVMVLSLVITGVFGVMRGVDFSRNPADELIAGQIKAQFPLLNGYTAEDFGIETVKSKVDFNKNGVDDYTDILLGARQDAINHPTYDGSYVAGGYPADDKGVCTDVVWRAFKNAGYSLKDMVDKDIKENVSSYPRVEGRPDTHIDFRRVPNLMTYFSRKAVSLTLDINDYKEWQAGDIVTYAKRHIGIVSDVRNADGRPFLIHNAGQWNREEDDLPWADEITGHFRFDASKLEKSDLISWKQN